MSEMPNMIEGTCRWDKSTCQYSLTSVQAVLDFHITCNLLVNKMRGRERALTSRLSRR